jgi:putative membrane protein
MLSWRGVFACHHAANDCGEVNCRQHFPTMKELSEEKPVGDCGTGAREVGQDSPVIVIERPANPPASVVHKVLLFSGIAFLAWSGFQPNGRFNWLMETLPAILGGIALVAVYGRFRFTTTSYVLVWIFSIILMVGGHYTYAEVPIGNWARDVFGFSRNHFDRLGHVFQGVIPAMLARELLLRTSPLRAGKWLFALSVSVALAISASYELFEWQYAVIFGGEQAEDFLGSQGDIWDAQKDMFMALCGAVIAQLVLGPLQLKQLGFAKAPKPPPLTNHVGPGIN